MRDRIRINRKEKKHLSHLERTAFVLVYLSFLVPVVFLILMMIFKQPDMNESGYHSYADYMLMIVECLLGLLALHIPSFMERKLKFVVPTVLYVMYMIFLYCAIFLGEVRSFYYIIPHWDTWLHGLSSLMTGFFGVLVVSILNHDEHTVLRLSPAFVAVFSFCFSMTVGAVWEIYEFVFDGLMKLNMQKYMLSDGTVLTGHEALSDTMKDIIVDALGALAASLFGYISICRNLTWFIPTLNTVPDGEDAESTDDPERKMI